MHQESQQRQHQHQQQQQQQQPQQQTQQQREQQTQQQREQRTPTRQVVAQLVTLGALLLSAALFGAGVAPALAAPQHLARGAHPARLAHSVAAPAPAVLAASIATKVVLPETSIDGPALASIIPTAPNETTQSVLGWTGTDAVHHLNVETSSDGLHFGNKLTLDETSPFRPAVTLLTQSGPFSIAWTGTDANHSLNVEWDVLGNHPTKLTLRQENSFTAPGLLQGESGPNDNLLFLAWTGTDANHSLNILPITISTTTFTFTLGAKHVLSQFSSNAGPQLSPAGFNPQGGTNSIALNWTSRALQPMAAIGNFPDLLFSSIATLPETSAVAPDTAFHVEVQNGPTWISWTGTDAAHHLNLESTTTFPSFPNPKTILGDTAFGGPALALNDGNQLAWTGTDAAHHLNIAKFA